MAPIHDIFRQALALPDGSVDVAMAAALPTADAAARRLLALSLLKRQHAAGTRALIEHFHILPGDVRQQIIAHANELAGAIRRAAQRHQGEGPANAISIIEQAQATRLAYLVTALLREGEPPIPAQAGRCLQHLARRAATDPRPNMPPGIDAVEAGFLQQAVEQTVAYYSLHRQQPVILAMLAMLPRPMPETFQQLAKPRQPAAGALQRLLTKADSPLIRRGLLPLLAVRPLRDAAISGLNQCAATGRLSEPLGQYHLLSYRPIGRALISCRAPEALWPSAEPRSALEPHAARGLAPLADALPWDPGERINRLAELAELAEPSARLMALRRLIRLAEGRDQYQGRAREAITRFCHDPDLSVARMAVNYLARRPHEDLARLLGQLLHAPHEEIRSLAGRHLSPIGFTRLWESWPRMDAPRRRAAGRALAKIDPHFDRPIAEKLTSRSRANRLRAIAMIRELALTDRFEHRLGGLLEGDDPRLASAAAKALGAGSGEGVAKRLQAALDHADARVRANAIESLAELGPADQLERFKELARSESAARPRANAITGWAAVEPTEAVRALEEMLRDERANHRLSALWVAQQHPHRGEVAAEVARLAGHDPDPQVRARAMELSAEMGAEAPASSHG